MKLAGKRVLLTGASSGIGRALALEMASRGASLAIAARRAELLDAVADEAAAGGAERPLVMVADLAERGAAADLAEQALAGLGRVDVLVNNAGGGVGGIQWIVGDREEARETFELNLWSPLALIATLVPAMRERREGAIVNVTSVSQVMALWAMGHYAATKAALAQATETLRLELRGSGVHVLEVIPGPVDTAVQGESRLIPGAERVFGRAPLGDPVELARLAARALERERNRLVYPRRLALLYAFPPLYRRYILSQAGRLASEIDTDDRRVVRTGSMGDQIARDARAAWESRRGA